MQTQLKHRLIGATVILALVAIFLPMLWEHSDLPNQLSIPTHIPSPPPDMPVAQSFSSTVNVDQPEMMVAPEAQNRKLAEPIKNIKERVSKVQTVQTEKGSSGSQPVTIKTVKQSNKPVFQHPKPIVTHHALNHLNAPHAWVLQVGSFSNAMNAKHLVERLRKKGFPAYIVSSNHLQKSQLTRVMIGPGVQREKLLKMQQRLEREFHLKGLIKRFVV